MPGVARRAVANEGLVDRASMAPTETYRATATPPAAAIRPSALAGMVPSAKETRNEPEAVSAPVDDPTSAAGPSAAQPTNDAVERAAATVARAARAATRRREGMDLDGQTGMCTSLGE